MSAKPRTVFRCTSCGADYPRWSGKCEVCGEWNTLVEEAAPRAPANASASRLSAARRAAGSSGFAAGGQVATAVRLADVSASEETRWNTGVAEFDFVLGGGIVPGSMILVGGEPGIGKSTILLQVAASLQSAGGRALYVSGEESALQVKLRANRLTNGAAEVELLGETLLETILATALQLAPNLLIVDSIQTVFTADLDSAPGSIAQVRECAARLMRFAKESGITVIVVGHVTREGGIAGPKTLEHIVDTVLYFEGEGRLDHRILRATKNRFGSVDEIGVFRMTGSGLEPVDNPSELFLGDRTSNASGSATTAIIEGSRPVLVEVQALAVKSGYGTPQRVSTGFDSRRLALLLAVLEKRAGLSFSQLDVFLNIAGGVRLQEPAADLAVAVALASSIYDRAVPRNALFIGEIGLAGEIRPVSQSERRLAEAAKMGHDTAYLSARSIPSRQRAGISTVGVTTMTELLGRLFG